MPDAPAIPGYEILEVLGANGYLPCVARHSGTAQVVFLKVVRSTGTYGRAIADGFRRQATMLAGLDHLNILRVVDVGEVGEYAYLALEYAGGGTLGQRLLGGPLPAAEASAIAADLADAARHARDQGFVPAALNPWTVRFTSGGVPKLAAFHPAVPGAGERQWGHEDERVYTPPPPGTWPRRS